MAFSVSVRILDVTCIDKESGSDNRDAFILLGAVVANGKSHAFGFETVALRSNESFSYYERVFNEIVESGPIGLALSGWETDRSSDWARVRGDAKKTAEVVGAVVDKLDIPVVGSAVAAIIEHIPHAIDFFASLDKDDNILKWAGELSLESPPHQQASRVYTFNASGRKMAGPVVLSDWNYQVTVEVACTDLVPLFPANTHEPTWTKRELSGSKVKDWLGTFKFGAVSCSIGRSDSFFGPLRIWFTDETGENFEIASASIAGKTSQLMKVKNGNDLLLKPVGIRPVAAQARVTNAAGILATQRFDHVSRLGSATAVEPELALAAQPIFLQLGGDRVALPNGGVLEIHETLADGKPTGGRVLRYARPATVDSLLAFTPLDVDLVLEPYSRIN